MNPEFTLDDLATLAESVDLECKSAQGRDGRGELPEDFWKSYSAMANSDGGVIWLGIQEKPRGRFHALGLIDVARVRKALWDNLHNRKQVSANLLSEDQIQPSWSIVKPYYGLGFLALRARLSQFIWAPTPSAARICAATREITWLTMRPCAACWQSG